MIHWDLVPGNLPKRTRVNNVPDEDMADVQETERERLIRTGQATPFCNIEGKEKTIAANITQNKSKANTPLFPLRGVPPANPIRKQQSAPVIRHSNAFGSPPPVSGSNVIVKKKPPVTPKSNKEITRKKLDKLKKLKRAKPKVPTVAFEGDPSDIVFEGSLRIPLSVWEKLYQHQQTSVKWLWELYCNQTGGIIADEMGLGKTIQAVCFCAGLDYSKLLTNPILIICPATILKQWKEEFELWWPNLTVEIFHESFTTAKLSKEKLLMQVIRKNGVIVTSYGTFQAYADLFDSQPFQLVFLDEGHKIRNPDAKITIECKRLQSPNRIILTRSPIQNNLLELWSLFDFVFPGKLGTLPVFQENFGV
jgi:hypothetical protein